MLEWSDLGNTKAERSANGSSSWLWSHAKVIGVKLWGWVKADGLGLYFSCQFISMKEVSPACRVRTSLRLLMLPITASSTSHWVFLFWLHPCFDYSLHLLVALSSNNGGSGIWKFSLAEIHNDPLTHKELMVTWGLSEGIQAKKNNKKATSFRTSK